MGNSPSYSTKTYPSENETFVLEDELKIIADNINKNVETCAKLKSDSKKYYNLTDDELKDM